MIKIINSKKKALEIKMPNRKEARDHDIPDGEKWKCKKCGFTLTGGIFKDFLKDKLFNKQEIKIYFLSLTAKCLKCDEENILIPDKNKLVESNLNVPLRTLQSPIPKNRNRIS